MNNRHGRANFKNFRVLLGIGFSSMTVMIRLVEKPHPEKYYVMQWHRQAGNITTNHKVKLYLTLPAFSAMNALMWKFRVDGSAKGRYNIILGRGLLT